MNEIMEEFEKWFKDLYDYCPRNGGTQMGSHEREIYDAYEAGRESMKTPPGDPQDWENILRGEELKNKELSDMLVRVNDINKKLREKLKGYETGIPVRTECLSEAINTIWNDRK
ncbi:MAG: hypothetical protein GY800_08955 [Planctomycetes bacterium]|nr:hypothetical protein [Planctomycetota bacterium]